jgi:hypothetical protein
MNGKRLIVGVCAMLALAVLLTMPTASAGGNGIVALANGSGQIHTGNPPELRTFSFTAQKDSAGGVNGQTEADSRSGDHRWHGTINCLNVSGNVATMSGVVTDITNPVPPYIVVGSNIQFQVIDNGHGANGTPDMISLTGFYGTGAGNNPGCTGTGTYAKIPIEGGNVTVH